MIEEITIDDRRHLHNVSPATGAKALRSAIASTVNARRIARGLEPLTMAHISRAMNFALGKVSIYYPKRPGPQLAYRVTEKGLRALMQFRREQAWAQAHSEAQQAATQTEATGKR